MWFIVEYIIVSALRFEVQSLCLRLLDETENIKLGVSSNYSIPTLKGNYTRFFIWFLLVLKIGGDCWIFIFKPTPRHVVPKSAPMGAARRPTSFQPLALGRRSSVGHPNRLWDMSSHIFFFLNNAFIKINVVWQFSSLFFISISPLVMLKRFSMINLAFSKFYSTIMWCDRRCTLPCLLHSQCKKSIVPWIQIIIKRHK